MIRTVNALNRLAGHKFEHPLPQHAHRPPTAVQERILSRVRSAIHEAGDCPDAMACDSALNELMRSHNLYDGEPGNLAQYDPSKLIVLRSVIKPRPLSDLLPPHVLPLFRRRHAHILRDPEEFQKFKRDNPDCCPRQPYWDPLLRHDPDLRIDFLQRLYTAGLLSFRTRIHSRIGIFFVRKKSPDAIRMVIDARITNAHHRQPPVTRLGSSINYGDLDLSPDSLGRRFSHSAGSVGWGAEMDVSDCFYQFDLKEMGSWFGIDYPNTMQFWREQGFDIQSVYDEDTSRNVKVDPGVTLFPVISVMPMGWTWALFFANETVAHIMRQTDELHHAEMRGKLPVPQLWDSRTITSTYADNVAIIGAEFEHVQNRMKKIDAAFSERQIPIVWTQDQPVRCLETVGCIVDFELKRLKQKPSRIWRVHLAGLGLARRSKVRPQVVQVWLGHATSLMRLCPFFLSVFEKIYRFIRIESQKRIVPWPSVRAEILCASNLV